MYYENNRKVIGSIKPIAMFTMIHIFILYGLYVTGFLAYEVKDDFLISAIASGAFSRGGGGSAHLIYMNLVLGKVFKTLFRLFPVVNWVPVSYLVVSILAFSLFCYMLISKYGRLWGQVFSYIVLLLMIPVLYQKINYTKFAGTLTIIGFLFIQYVYEIEQLKNRKLWSMVGILLVLTGSMLRFKAFLLCAPFGLLSMLYGIVVKSISRERIQRLLVAVACAATLILSTVIIDKVTYARDDQWKEYLEFNVPRTELFDYTFASYEEKKEEYNRISVSENDLIMIKNGKMLDTQVFSADRLNEIVRIRDQEDSICFLNIDFLKRLAAVIATNYLKNSIMIIALILSASTLISRKKWIWVIVNWILGFGELAFLEYMGRPIERVTILPMIGVLFTLLYNGTQDEIKMQKEKIPIGYIYAVMSSMVFLTASLVTVERVEQSETARDFVQEVKGKEGLYICSASDIYRGYSVFDMPMNGDFENIIFETGWLAQTPIINDNINKYLKTDNLYGAILDNSELYFVQYADRVRLIFLREHYSNRIGCSLIGNECGYNIYTYAAPLSDNRISSDTWKLKFNVSGGQSDEKFYQAEISFDKLTETEDVYLEICDAMDVNKCYIYKAVKNGNEIFCNFDSED